MQVAEDTEFDALFRSEYSRLVAIGVAMTGSREIARDLAQDTMARALANWSTVTAVDSQGAWVRRVMTNATIDHLRRSATERTAIDRLSARPAPDAGLPADSRLIELLGELSHRQRAVVVLHYVDDRSVAEIADALGIATGTVKALLWKARRRLELHLRQEDK